MPHFRSVAIGGRSWAMPTNCHEEFWKSAQRLKLDSEISEFHVQQTVGFKKYLYKSNT
jgi:hypothetical protein